MSDTLRRFQAWLEAQRSALLDEQPPDMGARLDWLGQLGQRFRPAASAGVDVLPQLPPFPGTVPASPTTRPGTSRLRAWWESYSAPPRSDGQGFGSLPRPGDVAAGARRAGSAAAEAVAPYVTQGAWILVGVVVFIVGMVALIRK